MPELTNKEKRLVLSAAMSVMGRARNPKKGFGSMTPEKIRAAQLKSAETRRRNREREESK